MEHIEHIIKQSTYGTFIPTSAENVREIIDAPPKNHTSSISEYGLATFNTYGHAKPSYEKPLENSGLGSPGTTPSIYAMADHTHPAVVSVLQAERLTTGRLIGIGGAITVPAESFNGENNLILNATHVNADYLEGMVPFNVLPVGIGSDEIAIGNHNHNDKYLKISGGTLSGSILPATNNLDLGSSNNKWNNIYANTFLGSLTGTASRAITASYAFNAEHSVTATDAEYASSSISADTASRIGNTMIGTPNLPVYVTSTGIVTECNRSLSITASYADDLSVNKVLSVNKGGTGLNSVSSKSMLYGDGTNKLKTITIGSTNQILSVNSSGIPEFSNIPEHKHDSVNINPGNTENMLLRTARNNITNKLEAVWHVESINPESIKFDAKFDYWKLLTVKPSGTAQQVKWVSSLDILSTSIPINNGSYVLTGNKTNDIKTVSWETASFSDINHNHDDRYLKLTGGEINGNLSLSASSDLTLSKHAGLNRIAYFDATGKIQSDASITTASFSKTDHTHLYAGSATAGGPANDALLVGNDYHIPVLEGGFFKYDGAIDGAVTVVLPTGWVGTMISFTVVLFDDHLEDNLPVEYRIGGYLNRNGYWRERFAYSLSGKNSPYADLPVRFGYDGSKCAIQIGRITSDLGGQTEWRYPQIFIRDLHCGYAGLSYNTWKTGWSITFETEELPQVDVILTDVKTQASTADRLKTSRALKIGNKSHNFDGSAGLEWTLADIGAAPKNHASSTSEYGVAALNTYGHAKPSYEKPLENSGLGSPGTTPDTFAMADHTHPAVVSVLQAERLTTGRLIGIGGAITVPAESFNGENNLILNATHINADYLKGMVPFETLPIGTGSNKIPSYNHLNNYLLLSGGIMSGDITFPHGSAIIQNQLNTSNYTRAIKWHKNGESQAKNDPQIGQHNTGGDSTNPGTITILPYATESDPWGGSVGLHIRYNQAKLDGNIMLTSANYTSYPKIGTTSIGSSSHPVYVNSGTVTQCNETLTITASYATNAVSADTASRVGNVQLGDYDLPVYVTSTGIVTACNRSLSVTASYADDLSPNKTLNVSKGGTGKSSFNSNAILLGGSSSTSAFQQMLYGSPRQVLTSGGSNVKPVWLSSDEYERFTGGGINTSTAVSISKKEGISEKVVFIDSSSQSTSYFKAPKASDHEYGDRIVIYCSTTNTSYKYSVSPSTGDTFYSFTGESYTSSFEASYGNKIEMVCLHKNDTKAWYISRVALIGNV